MKKKQLLGSGCAAVLGVAAYRYLEFMVQFYKSSICQLSSYQSRTNIQG